MKKFAVLLLIVFFAVGISYAKSVQYWGDGSMRSIGDKRVEYWGDGTIRSIGGKRVDYWGDGSIRSIED